MTPLPTPVNPLAHKRSLCPSPFVNLGSPLQRIAADGLSEACQELQIAQSLSPCCESLLNENDFFAPPLYIALASQISRRSGQQWCQWEKSISS